MFLGLEVLGIACFLKVGRKKYPLVESLFVELGQYSEGFLLILDCFGNIFDDYLMFFLIWSNMDLFYWKL